MPGSN
jgi:hypothetical protein